MSSEADYDQKESKNMKGDWPHSSRPVSISEAEDFEMHGKKDCPPRFSTLFEPKSEVLPFRPVEVAPKRKRRAGVFIPMPLCILLAIAFFFESTLLFAYTVIGLYNNLPSKMIPTNHGLSRACDMSPAADRQAAINIAPNFLMGQGTQSTVTATVTVTQNTASSSPPTSSTTASMSVVTVTPGGGTVTSLVLITKSSESASAVFTPTSFSTVFVAPSVLAAQQSASSSSAAEASSKSAASEPPPSSTRPPPPSAPPTTTSAPPPASTSAPPAPPAPPPPSSSSSAPPPVSTSPTNGKVCMGGSGAVQLSCF